MFKLIAASAYFLLIHFGISGTDCVTRSWHARRKSLSRGIRSRLPDRLVWMIYGYRRAPTVDLWGQLPGLRPLAFALVFVAFLFVVIGLATPSPTLVGMESKLAQEPTLPRHSSHHAPSLPVGRGTLALVHLIVNGDLASFILFGSLLLLARAARLPLMPSGAAIRRWWARFAKLRRCPICAI